jgi:hypothetical protein
MTPEKGTVRSTLVAHLLERPEGDWVLEQGTLVVTSAEKRTFGGGSDFQILATDAQGRRWEFRIGAGGIAGSREDLMGLEVVQVVALPAGELRLEFSDGTALTQSPHPRFEAWEVRCDEDPLLICAPGGGLIVVRP